jgi:hypothetical protein
MAEEGGDEDAAEAAEGGEGETLDQHQADEAPGPGSEREADGHFGFAGGGTGEEEIGDIGDDQQEEEDRDSGQGSEQGEHLSLGTPGRLPEWQHRDADVAVAVGIGLLEPAHDRLDADLRPVAGNAVAEACDGVQPPDAARLEHAPDIDVLVRHRDRNPEVEAQPPHGPPEFGRRDADHGEDPSGNLDRASDDPRVAPEPALPQSMADDRHRVPSRCAVLVRVKGASENRPDSEDVEEIGGGGLGPDPFDVAIDAEGDGFDLGGDDSGEEVGLGGEVADVGQGERFVEFAVDLAFGQDDQPAGVGGARDGIDEDPVDPAEDDGAGADAEGQGEDGDEGEARGLEELAKRGSKVVHGLGINPRRARRRPVRGRYGRRSSDGRRRDDTRRPCGRGWFRAVPPAAHGRFPRSHPGSSGPARVRPGR